jgi:hypothetical protein
MSRVGELKDAIELLINDLRELEADPELRTASVRA